ncbi:MAG: hypothetical protein OSA97_10375 [Nevskia sp.]|nr:hypothetical protein [Nevskia sp.]
MDEQAQCGAAGRAAKAVPGDESVELNKGAFVTGAARRMYRSRAAGPSRDTPDAAGLPGTSGVTSRQARHPGWTELFDELLIDLGSVDNHWGAATEVIFAQRLAGQDAAW